MTPSSPATRCQKMARDIDDREGESPSPTEPRLGGCSTARRPAAAVKQTLPEPPVFVKRFTRETTAAAGAGRGCTTGQRVTLPGRAAKESAADLAQDKAGRGVLVPVEVRQVDFEVDAARAVRVVGVAPGSDLAATAERGQQPELGAAAREQPVAGGGAEVPGLARDVARVAEVGDGAAVAAERRADRRHAADLGVPGDDVHGDLRALGVPEQDLLLVRAVAHGRRELLLGVGYALALAAGVVRQRRRVDHRFLADRLRAGVG